MTELTGDAARIAAGIEQAEIEGRLIDAVTARLIASQLHDGQSSAYYALASSGHVDCSRLPVDIARDRSDANLDGEARRWLGYLALYVLHICFDGCPHVEETVVEQTDTE